MHKPAFFSRLTATLLPLLLVGALPLAAPAFAADDAAEAVRAFYTAPLADERDPALFTGSARATIETDLAAEGGCIGFSFVFNGQDFDEAEVARTLDLSTAPGANGDETVTASFDNFGERQQVVWTMRQTEDAWKVADVAIAFEGDGDWTLSAACD
jgi:hypothetical protein